ncbi:putative membrane protein YphA (DoxX/SURF4 family) [Hamadaea flava]|uniref:DoxX family protein n=1 Tax=Hamadaea flava TaxID=1742688 RepID=A0ABV8LEH8_9ACTN|nr:DoxX family protein [Hamadaea flava]MCP2326022.1 putative membrane protein YphA (DoxX/SURF4 family) [Hamadaea flava]
MAPVRGIARALLGGVFIFSGAKAVLRPERLVQRARPVTDRVTPLLNKVDERIPANAETLIRVNGAAQVTGGLLLASGAAPRPAAALLAGTLIPTTVAGHPFWAAQTKAQYDTDIVQFAKNLAIFGGLLLAAVDTAGSPSVGWRVRHYLDSRTSDD